MAEGEGAVPVQALTVGPAVKEAVGHRREAVLGDGPTGPAQEATEAAHR